MSEEKFESQQLKNASQILWDMVDSALSKTGQAFDEGDLYIEDFPPKLMVKINFTGEKLPEKLSFSTKREDKWVPEVLAELEKEEDGKLYYKMSVTDPLTIRRLVHAANLQVCHWFNDVKGLNFTMPLMDENLGWVASVSGIRLYQPSAEKYADKYNNAKERQEDALQLLNYVWKKMNMRGEFPTPPPDGLEFMLPNLEGKIVVGFHKKDHSDFLAYKCSGRYIEFKGFTLEEIKKCHETRRFPGSDLLLHLDSQSQGVEEKVKAQTDLFKSPVPKRQKKNVSFDMPTDAQPPQSLYDSPKHN